MIEIIYNPISGNNRKSRRTAEKVSEFFGSRGVPSVIRTTEYPGHATVLAKNAVESGADAVAAVGGDGTASETACGLVHTDCPLLIVPAGTGNDFRKSVSIPSDPLKAAELYFSGRQTAIDIGQINDRYFINEVGAGFDVDVLRHSVKYKKHLNGLLPYLFGVLDALRQYHTLQLEMVDENGVSKTEDATVFSAANGKWIGGGIKISPEAEVADGLLDFTVVNAIQKNRLPSRLAGLLKGNVLHFPETTHTKGRGFVISAPDMYVNIDGDVVRMNCAVIRVVPKAIRIFCPVSQRQAEEQASEQKGSL